MQREDRAHRCILPGATAGSRTDAENLLIEIAEDGPDRTGLRVAEAQTELVPAALQRAHAYLEAGADCVYPIGLWETDALCSFMAEIRGPVNVFPIPKTLLPIPQTPSLAELAGERPS